MASFPVLVEWAVCYYLLFPDDDVAGLICFADCCVGCGHWGIPVVDTTSGKFRVYYFELFVQPGPKNDAPIAVDNFNAIYECFRDNGVSGCYHLASLWA